MANNNSATSTAQLRLASLSAQLDTTAPRDPVTEILETSLPPVRLHADALSALLDGQDQTWRKWTFEQLKHPLFEYQYNVPKEELVTRNQERTRHLAKLGFRPTWTEPKDNIDKDKFMQIQDALSYFDNGLSTLNGAHFGLYYGSIRELGSEAVQNKWLPLADTFEVPGCFALTELGHGSNPRGIETEAHWDFKEGCYIINTPNTTAQKYWIGAAAETAYMSVVWAQLYIPHPTDPSHPPSHKGIHAFLVPIRDLTTRSPLPGVTIRNCGSKSGLNGVDNGRLWFDHVKVPRHMCLDKYGGVNEQGVYESFFGDNNDQRFGGQLVNLSEGRVGLSISSDNISKTALTIAVRYGLTRRQFGARQVGELETLIMDYKLHQRRLYPLLAQTYAQHFAARAIARLRDADKTDLKLLKQFHVISSGLKSLHTWHLLDTLQATREACGGQGLKSSNRIGQMKADCDVMATYEGDNQVMLITVAKGCINDYKPTRIPPLANFTSQHFSDSTLLSPKFQLDLFQHHIHASAHRLHAAIDLSRAQAKAQGTPNIGLDKILDTHSALSQEFARAVIEHWILSEFIAQETLSSSSTSGTGSSPLTLMRQLHALWKLDMDQNIIRRRYLDEPVQERIRDLVGGLLHRVHENITPLVDAFGVPDHLLGPIAGDWVQANVAEGSEDI
ncbi:acyl-CoA oxidase [Linnemannia elongata AG-77]|uniref:Acyl-coenzyme A oxidase n=1 Tax=Linnemannia elongata AG-77 TaxID=1314771 RepID=A0A197K666_9FUNG|nr:acyl-CoA oxidase [Linnemannia elongata AG-77]